MLQIEPITKLKSLWQKPTIWYIYYASNITNAKFSVCKLINLANTLMVQPPVFGIVLLECLVSTYVWKLIMLNFI